MATNSFGLDAAYFSDKLSLVLRDLSHFTPEELARALARMARTACEGVLGEAEFTVQAAPTCAAQDGDAQLDAMRRSGLSIDGDNAYKRDLIDCIVGALMLGKQGVNPPPAGHWLEQFWQMARGEGEIQEQLAAAPAAPVAQEPVAWRVSDPNEPEIGFWLSEEPGTSWHRSEPLYTAPPATEQPDTVNLLVAALRPFADAFDATGLPQYRGADAEHAAFLDENQVTPARGITMGQFRRAWEVLSGKSVLRGAEQQGGEA